MIRNQRGVTPFDVVVGLVVFANLAAVAVPRFVAMQTRAREGIVRTNMHMLQVTVEEFAAENGGEYPTYNDGPAVEALMPGGITPRNPFTGVACVIGWGGYASARGELGYDAPGYNEYRITGFGEKQLLDDVITNVDGSAR